MNFDDSIRCTRASQYNAITSSGRRRSVKRMFVTRWRDIFLISKRCPAVSYIRTRMNKQIFNKLLLLSLHGRSCMKKKEQLHWQLWNAFRNILPEIVLLVFATVDIIIFITNVWRLLKIRLYDRSFDTNLRIVYVIIVIIIIKTILVV